MNGEQIPRFKVRALPPIGRREPGNSIPQLFRALAIMGFASVVVAVVATAHRVGESRRDAAAAQVQRA
jgi:hypothetical protein